jgi:hypothetical protein
MNAPQFEAIKARAFAGEPISPEEIAQLTPRQADELAAFRREQAGYVLDEGPDPRELYREKPEP